MASLQRPAKVAPITNEEPPLVSTIQNEIVSEVFIVYTKDANVMKSIRNNSETLKLMK